MTTVNPEPRAGASARATVLVAGAIAIAIRLAGVAFALWLMAAHPIFIILLVLPALGLALSVFFVFYGICHFLAVGR